MNIFDYFKKKRFGAAASFLKKHQIDALVLSLIVNDDERNLDVKLKERWEEITGDKFNYDDETFIDYMLRLQPYTTYSFINDKGANDLDAISNKFLLVDLVRKTWFYLFVAENYKNLSIDSLKRVITDCEKREIENNYKKEEEKYYLNTMLDSLNDFEIRVTELGKTIEKKYLDDLYSTYDLLLDYLEGYDYDRFSELRYIFDIDKKDFINSNAKDVVETKPVPKNKEVEDNKEILIKDNDNLKLPKEVDELSFIKEKTFDNSLKNAEELLNEYGIYTNANLCWNMFKKYIEETDAIIDALKSQLESQKALYEKENSKLKQANDILNNKIKTQEFDMEAVKRKSIEDFILKLNGEENSCVLDLLYDIKIGKETNPDVMAHISTIFFNILKKQGYYLMTENVGKEINKPAEELVEQFRWDSDENVNGKVLVVDKPGLIIKKYNRVIYKPKVIIKK